MDSSSLVRVQSRFLFLGGVAIFCNILIVVFTVSRHVSLKKDIQLDKERFYTAVELGTSNFLSSVYQPLEDDHSYSSSRASEKVKVVFVPDLTTWSSPRKGPMCRIAECTYSIGDYTEYGLVIGVADGRVYVDTGDGVVILRRGRSESDAGDGSPPSAARPGVDDFGMADMRHSTNVA